MYSPKIKEDLIPQIYLLAKKKTKEQGKRYPMTRLVNEVLGEYLKKEDIPKSENLPV